MDTTGRTRWVYQELRDRKVVMFIVKLPQGVWELRYQLRAEVPGDFHALPVSGPRHVHPGNPRQRRRDPANGQRP